MIEGHQRWPHPDRHPIRVTNGLGDQLDAVSKVMRQVNIGQLHPTDALNLGRREIGATAKGQRGQQGDLVAGIEAAHVHGRVSLGVSLGLGLGQHIGKSPPAGFHFGQDVIAGAVENPGDRIKGVAH